jgi:hypothetical protein
MQTDNVDLVMTYNCGIWLQIDICFEELRKLPSAQTFSYQIFHHFGNSFTVLLNAQNGHIILLKTEQQKYCVEIVL